MIDCQCGVPISKAEVYRPIVMGNIDPLPIEVEEYTGRELTGRLTRDRLELIMKQIPAKFLGRMETNIIAHTSHDTSFRFRSDSATQCF